LESWKSILLDAMLEEYVEVIVRVVYTSVGVESSSVLVAATLAREPLL